MHSDTAEGWRGSAYRRLSAWTERRADRSGLTEEDKAQLFSQTPLLAREQVQLEIYVDHCVVEIYAEGGAAVLTHVVQPQALCGQLRLPEGTQCFALG